MSEAKKIDAAIRQYDVLLDKHTQNLQQLTEEMSAACISAKLTFGGRTMFNVLRPNFLTTLQYDYLSTICSHLRNAITKFKNAALMDDSLMNQMGLIPQERKLVGIDPGYDRLSISARWDSFLAGDDLKFVELNAECPAGIAYQEVATAIYKKLPFVREFARTYHIQNHAIRRTLLNELLKTYRTWRGTKAVGRPTIAIVDWSDVPTYTEFELFADYFGRAGYKTIIADPRDLEFDGKYLRKGNTKINIVYKRVLTNDCVQRPDETKALVEACRHLKVCMINPFRAKIVHKKAIFAILTHERNAHLFNKAELKVIGKHIPWTRMLVKEKTKMGTKDIDLVDYAMRHREGLVLKPNDEYGGKGVALGREVSQSDWEKRIAVALEEGDHIVQEVVKIPRARFPIMRDGKLQFEEMVVDLDPYVFGPRVEGVLTRLSASSLANVTAGGGTTPTFVIHKITSSRSNARSLAGKAFRQKRSSKGRLRP